MLQESYSDRRTEYKFIGTVIAESAMLDLVMAITDPEGASASFLQSIEVENTSYLLPDVQAFINEVPSFSGKLKFFQDIVSAIEKATRCASCPKSTLFCILSGLLEQASVGVSCHEYISSVLEKAPSVLCDFVADNTLDRYVRLLDSYLDRQLLVGVLILSIDELQHSYLTDARPSIAPEVIVDAVLVLARRDRFSEAAGLLFRFRSLPFNMLGHAWTIDERQLYHLTHSYICISLVESQHHYDGDRSAIPLAAALATVAENLSALATLLACVCTHSLDSILLQMCTVTTIDKADYPNQFVSVLIFCALIQNRDSVLYADLPSTITLLSDNISRHRRSSHIAMNFISLLIMLLSSPFIQDMAQLDGKIMRNELLLESLSHLHVSLSKVVSHCHSDECLIRHVQYLHEHLLTYLLDPRDKLLEESLISVPITVDIVASQFQASSTSLSIRQLILSSGLSAYSLLCSLVFTSEVPFSNPEAAARFLTDKTTCVTICFMNMGSSCSTPSTFSSNAVVTSQNDIITSLTTSFESRHLLSLEHYGVEQQNFLSSILSAEFVPYEILKELPKMIPRSVEELSALLSYPSGSPNAKIYQYLGLLSAEAVLKQAKPEAILSESNRILTSLCYLADDRQFHNPSNNENWHTCKVRTVSVLLINAPVSVGCLVTEKFLSASTSTIGFLLTLLSGISDAAPSLTDRQCLCLLAALSYRWDSVIAKGDLLDGVFYALFNILTRIAHTTVDSNVLFSACILSDTALSFIIDDGFECLHSSEGATMFLGAVFGIGLSTKTVAGLFLTHLGHRYATLAARFDDLSLSGAESPGNDVQGINMADSSSKWSHFRISDSDYNKASTLLQQFSRDLMTSSPTMFSAADASELLFSRTVTQVSSLSLYDFQTAYLGFHILSAATDALQRISVQPSSHPDALMEATLMALQTLRQSANIPVSLFLGVDI